MHTGEIEQMYAQAGVKLLYLPPYSLDLKPIKEFFAELKAFIKKQWHDFELITDISVGKNYLSIIDYLSTLGGLQTAQHEIKLMCSNRIGMMFDSFYFLDL